MITVTYLDHSGFAVTAPTAIMVFDYYKDPDKKLEKVLRSHPDPEVPVLFFVTHHHTDHFNTSIFELAQNRKRTYILSNDIFSKLVPQKGLSVAWMSPGDAIDSIPGLKEVRAYGSTDAGVSYLITLPDGKTIFHAGDLNDWHWSEESTPHEAAEEEARFNKIVNRLAEENPSIDIVMFPVDARLGKEFARGARTFLQKVNVGFFFPMHFWGEPQKACDFEGYVPEGLKTQCYCLDRPGMDVTIK
ncbi:MAG: MBL fold metallo-hydrolase [Muribaculaceae bacterium]|nr:MBL fold metallo-hydrolase [Muribaculaceae bacterium]